MSIAQSVNDPQHDTAEDVNPPDQASRLGRSYFWTPGQGHSSHDARPITTRPGRALLSVVAR